MKGTFEADFSEFKNEVDASVAKMRTFEGGTEGVNLTLGRLHDSLGRIDSVLSTVDVRIGSAVRSLAELQTASGQTVRELGAISTAGLAIGAGLGGWQLGRIIADFVGADEAISNATASLLGWGSAAAEVAGAKADVLARASEHAGAAITDLSEAMRINTDFAKQQIQHFELLRFAREQNRQAALKEIENDRELTLWARGVNDELARRAALERQLDEQRRRGMEEYERGLLREFELETKVWTDAIRMTDDLNARLQKKLDLQIANQAALAVEAQKAREANAERALGPGVSDPALEAAIRRDAALRDVSTKSALAPGIDVGPLIQKIWQDFDEQILKRGATAAAAGPPVQVNVSGIMDPRTIDELTDAIMRKTGRLWPGR